MNDDLVSKYRNAAIATGRRLHPTSFDRRLELRDSLDPHFTKLWLDFGMAGLAQRKVLDERTGHLVLIGQFAMTRSAGFLEDAIRAALAAKVPPREVLEVIIQCAVYGGNTVADPALELFARIAEELGLMEELQRTQLPLDGRDSTRSVEEERAQWHPEDRDDPRGPELAERHGWLGISTGVTVRPREHLNVLSYIDGLDPGFALLWERFTYQGMYGRRVLDDRTRILCIIGNCVAIGETIQIRNHMRAALGAGASPREVLEVVLQSCQHFGMPATMGALGLLYAVIKDEGRLGEIGDPPFPQREHGRG